MKKLVALSLLFVALCFTGVWAKGENSAALLAKVSQDPNSYGELIQQGTLYPLKGERSKPIYFYERHVRSEGADLISTSYTHDGQKVQLVETAVSDANYRVREFTENQFQLGEVGKVTVTGNKVQFYSVKGEKEKRADETVSLPVVVGPTFYGFIYQNWDALMAGKTVPFRLAVLSRMETVGFEFTKVDSAPNQIRIRMKPTAFAISLLVNPIHFTFSSADKSVISLEGRVPPKIKKGDDWADLDAYEVYKNIAPAFK
jgi:hypothetical protein